MRDWRFYRRAVRPATCGLFVAMLFFCIGPAGSCRLYGADADADPAAPVYGRKPKLYLGRSVDPEALQRAWKALEEKMAELDAEEKAANAAPMPSQLILPRVLPAGPITNLQEALDLKMTEMDLEERRARLLPGSLTNQVTATTNGTVFAVKGFDLIGNTLLAPDLTELILRPYILTNATIDTLRRALTDLHTVYHDRGYVTVTVGLPQQKLTNGIVRIRVFQGRLAEILVEGNRYFSSNNVMRALPGLHKYMILNSPVFQADLDRANANQDRQIYPEIEPGPEENTTTLRLNVKDRLPLHAKIEFNNYNTPDTPDLRLNGSLLYNNLWQHEHALGLQYSFSPEYYKPGESWNFYDKPLVVNYSAFYRMPLSAPEPEEDIVARNPGNFGYNEATRRFVLPPAPGYTALNIYASRAVTDTGLQTLTNVIIQDIPGVLSIRRQDVQEDITATSDAGWRLSAPLQASSDFQSSLAGGLDFKTYEFTGNKTNLFYFSVTTVNPDGSTNPPVTSKVASAVPTTYQYVNYLPLALSYSASVRDPLGVNTFGLGLSGNPWFSGPLSAYQSITGSSESTGHWFALAPSLTSFINIRTNWELSVHADGQWASQPLLSNEQYGIGGSSSVRGYHQGEVFGDSGWQVLLEQKTPAHLVGMVHGKQPLTLRGSIYMGYGETFLIDGPQGPQRNGQLWGTGFGFAASIGSYAEARFMFSWPLISTIYTEAYQPRFDFSISAQF